MRLVRFLDRGVPCWGEWCGDTIRPLWGEPYGGIHRDGRELFAVDVTLLPCVWPEKIIGVGLNYRDHIAAQGLAVPEEPYIVHRPRNTLNGNNALIDLGDPEHNVQFEGELACVIGFPCRNVGAAAAEKRVLGYTCADDITDKFYFARDKHFGVAKAMDGQCPVGPWIETDFDWREKRIVTRLNGCVAQDGSTADMVFGVGEIIAYLSRFMTLLPGDLVLTGSPAGSVRLRPGDRVEIEIGGLGCLRHTIQKQE